MTENFCQTSNSMLLVPDRNHKVPFSVLALCVHRSSRHNLEVEPHTHLHAYQFKKADFTSMNLIVFHIRVFLSCKCQHQPPYLSLATSAKTSSKSIPCLCAYPFATNLSLCLVTAPAASFFTLYTHFRSIGRTLASRSTRSHV